MVPAFDPGGVQIQAWDSGECEYDKTFFDGEQLSPDAERITWMQVLATNEEVLSFGIESGGSLIWEAFGEDHMKVSGSMHVPDLNSYSTATSLKNSWITYGANRVETLRIKEVRYYSATSLLHVDDVPKVVFSLYDHDIDG